MLIVIIYLETSCTYCLEDIEKLTENNNLKGDKIRIKDDNSDHQLGLYDRNISGIIYQAF